MNRKLWAGLQMGSFRRNRLVLAVAAALGMAGSAHAAVNGFGGSSMTGWTPNSNAGAATAGVPNVTGTGSSADVLSLTTAAGNEATSYWFNTPQDISNFIESFTYTNPSAGGADGIAAVWQNTGTTALGGGGGALGFVGIGSSAAQVFNIYGGNSGSGSQFSPTVTTGNNVALTPTPSTVNIASGHPINISLSYNGSALTETMTDTTNSATFSRVWRGVSIQSQVGGSTALVGFTGATGGVSASQNVTNFSFISGAAGPTPVATITPIAVTGFTQNMISSAASGAANVTATMDGGTGKGGDTYYEVGTNPNSNVSGLPKAGTVFGSATDVNHTFVFAPNGAGQNDAVYLDAANTTGTLTLTSPARYSTLSFLLASGGGVGTVNVSVHYANGTTQTAVVNSPDWFNNGPIAVDANGRANTALSDFNSVDGGNPRIYQQDLSLTDTSDAVTSVDFGYGGTNKQAIFGISGAVATPEPTVLGVIAMGVTGLLGRRRRRS